MAVVMCVHTVWHLVSTVSVCWEARRAGSCTPLPWPIRTRDFSPPLPSLPAEFEEPVRFISPNTAGSNGTQTNTKDGSRGVGRQTMDSEKEACLLTWRQSLFTRKYNTISISPCERGICRCCELCYWSTEMKNEEVCLLSYYSVSYICSMTTIICNTNSCFLNCCVW